MHELDIEACLEDQLVFQPEAIAYRHRRVVDLSLQRVESSLY